MSKAIANAKITESSLAHTNKTFSNKSQAKYKQFREPKANLKNFKKKGKGVGKRDTKHS